MTLALCVIFFLSGASALLFETLWFRLAGFTFGNSLWASSVVLAAFMGGLGLGNLLAARYGPKLKRPLMVYAAVEVVIGVVGFLLVLVFPLLTPVLAPIFRPFLDVPWVLQPLRLLFAFALLLVPATAMGATLPLLVKTLSGSDSNFGRVLGRLYGFNTLGAVVGALAGELYVIGLLGLRGTGLVAASLNFVAAIASVLVAKELAQGEVRTETGTSVPLTSGAFRLLAAAFVSGALLLGLEVVWFRFLQLFVLGSSLIFAVMLSVVLLGIAAGGIVASLWLGTRPGDYRHAPIVALVSAIFTAFTYILFDDGFGLYGPFPIKPVPDPRTAFFITLGLCGPVSFLSGILFTFFGRALGDELGDATKATAEITFANTMGAMLGSLLAGFLLIPIVGVEWTIFLLGFAYCGVAVASFGAGTSVTSVSGGESALPRRDDCLKARRGGHVHPLPLIPVRLDAEPLHPHEHETSHDGWLPSRGYARRPHRDSDLFEERSVGRAAPFQVDHERLCDVCQHPALRALHESVRVLARRDASGAEKSAPHQLRCRHHRESAYSHRCPRDHRRR